MKRSRRCKIVATLGPASNDEAMIEKLWRAGADLFRINMSHTDPAGMRERVAMIRAVEEKVGRPIGVLVDLQGPKLRVGAFSEGGADLVKGQNFILDSDEAHGDSTRVRLPHPEILESLQPGHKMLIDDGRLRLDVIEAAPGRAVTTVEVGGRISNRKGVSLPDTEIPDAAMTEKDRIDLAAAVETGVDWIALSFVQRAEDVKAVKAIVGDRAMVLAKIEKPQAITRLDEIMLAADGLMVARGDLGVEVPPEKVPGLQKRITREARRLGRPVIVATQMLESMITSPTPTRAEVSDVATAVFEGADAIMLSAESASGQYPIEAVEMMNRIAMTVEIEPVYRSIINAQRSAPEKTGADAVASAARDMAETLETEAIVAWTASGATALRVARERPRAPILALTPNRDTARRLTLVWGTEAAVTRDAHDVDDMANRACKFAVRQHFANPGDRIVIIAGVPFGTPGATNMLRIAFIAEDGLRAQ
ncbi:pyruvate kinase [Rhodoblastus sphagnicola]|uniref:Pyruvate kinase n=1 Tax=Rhodoblastus sphagnicola TaxID=333368 RepID=A0A2S6MUT7_9HYPH|nr:pyruvate kinase [Rhodoblastus sphagnicola]MBB4197104.1 pyruvate kinase [Rhodoblastus sphagnicola]PPQ26119.1 pyruvate kinase [Rhodoblastus sphagnicola]